jgi:hypothetical protein
MSQQQHKGCKVHGVRNISTCMHHIVFVSRSAPGCERPLGAAEAAAAAAAAPDAARGVPRPPSDRCCQVPGALQVQGNTKRQKVMSQWCQRMSSCAVERAVR